MRSAMARGQIERVIAALLCLALLLTSSSGAVWCRGEDGHLRLERGDDSCYGHAVSPLVNPAVACDEPIVCTGTSQLAGCGNCIDVPLTLGADKSRVAQATVGHAVLPHSTSIRLAPDRELAHLLPSLLSLSGQSISQCVLRL